MSLLEASILLLSPSSPPVHALLNATRPLGFFIRQTSLARARTPLRIGPDILAYLAVLLKTQLAIHIAPHG